MIKHLLGKHKRRKKEEQEDINIILQPFKFAEEITQPTEKMAKAFNDAANIVMQPFKDDTINDCLRQNVVKDHGYPFLLTAPDGTQNKIWIEAETYHAALLRAQGIAEQAGVSVVELW